MALPIKTYFPDSTRRLYELNRFLQRHKAVILSVTAVVSPADLPAVIAAIAAVATTTELWQKIEALIDPNAPPNE